MQRKTELVLRLVRGESLDAVSRENQVPAHELEQWHRVFVEQGKRGLRTKAEPEERELTLARAKIGELMMRLSWPRISSKKGLHGRVEEAQGMRERRSPGTGRRYPLTMICTTYRLARSSVYATAPAASAEPRGKRGPKTPISRRSVAGGDPRRPGGVSVSWGGLSQGARAARAPRARGERQARAAADACARPAGARAASGRRTATRRTMARSRPSAPT